MLGTYAAAVQRILIGRVVATCGAAVIVVGTFLPWLRSGTRRRTSYEIFSLVERLGYSRSGIVGWSIRLWPVVPLLVACAVTLLWFPRAWATGLATAAAAAYAGIVSAAVRSASPNAVIAVEYGASVTLAGAIVLALGALLSRGSQGG
jgi:hypothetical protein